MTHIIGQNTPVISVTCRLLIGQRDLGGRLNVFVLIIYGHENTQN